MKVSIHQPGYHRHIKYYCKILLSDVFIILDNVQYVDREWQNRQRLYYSGKYHWISVPVNNGREQIKEKIIVDSKVLEDHWKTICWVYSKAPYFNSYREQFERIYNQEWKYLADLNLAIDSVIMKSLDIATKMYKASDLVGKNELSLKKADLIIDLIKALNADSGTVTYLSGAEPEPVDYYLNSIYPPSTITEKQKIQNEGIEVKRYQYQEQTYLQQGQAEFIHNLPSIDLLFNLGPNAKNIVREYIAGNNYV